MTTPTRQWLTPEQLAFWKKNRYLLLRSDLNEAQCAELSNWTHDLSNWPETPGKWMKYFEAGKTDERQLCRVENFLPYHDGFRALLTGERLMGILSELMGETAILYKEKINYKMPGGGGFGAHQDAPAFTTFGQKYHITLMVSVDTTTRENGCLEVVEGYESDAILPQADDGTIHPDTEKQLRWQPLLMNPGDVLFFDSLIPHRSGPNVSNGPRRALYITYNRESEGAFRDEYFVKKREAFPPEIERVAGQPLTEEAKRYNLGNPIR